MNTEMQIQVPSPCNENWNQMTPSEKGRFCSLCAKTVVDFTLMSDAEIKSYLSVRKKDTVCGRFANSQLNRPLTYSKELSYSQKMVVVLFLVFGSMLFSCKFDNSSTLGEVSAIEDARLYRTMGSPMLVRESLDVNECEDADRLQLRKVEVEDPENMVDCATVDSENEIVLNEFVYVENDTANEDIDTDIVMHTFTMGMTVLNITENESDSLIESNQDPESLNCIDEEAKVNTVIASQGVAIFPNPAADNAMVSYVLKESALVSISVIDLQGRICKEILNAGFQDASGYSFPVNVSSLSNGSYVLQLMVDGAISTVHFLVQH